MEGGQVLTIQHVFRNRFHRIADVQQTLKRNQIIRGHIIKLYPDNKALIQLGMQKKIAQLEASLAVGERYYFQVQETKDVIHLKVLGDKLTHHPQANLSQLLNHLGVPINRHMIAFVQSLIQSQIPFDRHSLIQLIPLLNIAQDQQKAHHVIKTMLAHQLPLTSNVFSALYTREIEQFSSLLRNVLNGITIDRQQHTHHQQLVSNLNSLIGRPVYDAEFVRYVYEQSIDHESLEKLLKGFNLMKRDVTDQEGKRDITTLVKHELLFNREGDELRQIIKHLLSQQSHANNAARLLISTWEMQLKNLITTHSSMTPDMFSTFKQSLIKQLIPLLPSTYQQDFIQSIDNNPHVFRHVLDACYTLREDKTFDVLNRIILYDPSPKKAFLQHIHRILSLTGLNYEHLIRHDQLDQQPISLKQSLINVMQYNESTIGQERMQQLLHFINGLQVQSVEETSHLIYANLTLPGEKLRLNNDLFLQFQSKKTKNSEIDTDFCRILFYLDLGSLEETIIDMNIQNRVIAITVFNDHPILHATIKPLEIKLKHQLSELNYQLTSVIYKPLHEQPKASKDTYQFRQENYEGVDFRV